eukprot:g3736.t1
MGKKKKSRKKKKKRSLSNSLSSASADACIGKGEMSRELCELRRRYSLLGKSEWWWIMDDSLKVIASQLKRDYFVVLDGFLEDEMGKALRDNVREIHEAGELRKGVLGGGSSGASLSYVHERVRGDLVKWYNGSEACWKEVTSCKVGNDKKKSILSMYMTKVGTLISELGSAHVPSLRGIQQRSDAMVTCYPSGGARYTRHCDNHCNVDGKSVGIGDNCNGRRVTSLLYLNYDWRFNQGLGGELRIFAPDGKRVRVELPPLGGRLVLFWADFRVPHEVLPANFKRYAVTLWFFDAEERRRALLAAADTTEVGLAKKKAMEDKLRKEVEKFQNIYDGGAEGIGHRFPTPRPVDYEETKEIEEEQKPISSSPVTLSAPQATVVEEIKEVEKEKKPISSTHTVSPPQATVARENPTTMNHKVQQQEPPPIAPPTSNKLCVNSKVKVEGYEQTGVVLSVDADASMVEVNFGEVDGIEFVFEDDIVHIY